MKRIVFFLLQDYQKTYNNVIDTESQDIVSVPTGENGKDYQVRAF